MTHDLGVGRWRRGSRRESRATVTPVEEDTKDLRPDLTALAYKQMLDVAENRLIRAQFRIEALLALLAERHRWVGLTQDRELLAAIKSELFEVHLIVTGGTK